MNKGSVVKISGPLVVATGMRNVNIYDVVKVGSEQLLGEVIEIHGDNASIQLFEETSGLKVGSEVVSTYEPLSVELGPGLIGSIFDGIQRPLNDIVKNINANEKSVVSIPALNREKQWVFEPSVNSCDRVYPGDIIGYVQENDVIKHKIMMPPNVSGIVKEITAGTCTVEDVVAIVLDEKGNEHGIGIMQKWPVRLSRPYTKKLAPKEPLITGQRVIDTLFPIAKGGTAAIPGTFGSGKTILQNQLAKWSDADIIVYIGCGERGNEITDILNEYPKTVHPETGNSAMQRTIIIANTSDMPVAARESSIYTGITVAEYFRDMGYNVALIADSTTRWAEALREISARLEEMPGEEGYPAYLSSRLAQFYERAGRVVALGKDSREGTLTVIGAVSPAGGDFSEPVTQATQRIAKVFLDLDDSLANKRHFPAVNWLTSYSFYSDTMGKWFNENVNSEWIELKNKLLAILNDESYLQQTLQLVGADALTDEEKLKLITARSIREDFLQQVFFHNVDTYTNANKQYMMLKIISHFYDSSLEVIATGGDFEAITKLPVRGMIGKFKYVKENAIANTFELVMNEISNQTQKLTTEGEVDA